MSETERCAHNWRILGTTIQKPSLQQMNMNGDSTPELVLALLKHNERALCGATHYLLACDSCGALAERTIVGEPK
jgi:hypothetical protein